MLSASLQNLQEESILAFSSFQLLLFRCQVMSNSLQPWTVECQASLSFTISWSLLKLMCIESVMLSNHLVLCCALLLLPSIFLSIRVFSNESALRIRWPEYWSLASVLPMNIQGWFPLGLTGLISLPSKGLSRVFSSTTFECINSSALCLLYGQTLTLVYDSWEKKA